jgi:hypothetical protein
VLHTLRILAIDGLYYEVQEYCEGGALGDRVSVISDGTVKRVPPEWIMSTMVPQLNAGLSYLHKQDIVHRDIKPGNIYCKLGHDGKETLVLGDFDIASALDRMHTSRETDRLAGTWVYTAPEAFPRFVDEHGMRGRARVSRSSDYYSLGVTIIELLQGTTSLHVCELPDLFDFYLEGHRIAIPTDTPERLALLLRGLLIRNRHTRWGAEEVQRWVEKHNIEEDLKHIREDESYELPRVSHPYRLKGYSPVDLPGLADAMSREHDAGTKDLMSGDILLNWVGNIDANKAREIREAREKWRNAPEVALFSVIMICDPARPFVFTDGAETNTASEWLGSAERFIANTGAVSKQYPNSTMLRKLGIWLRLKSEPENEIADGVAEILKSPENVRFEELAYLIDEERPYQIRPGLSVGTPKELVRATYGKPDDWTGTGIPDYYEASRKRWEEGFLYAWMRQRGLSSVVSRAEQAAAKLQGYPYAAFETVLRLLDPDLKAVEVRLDPAAVPDTFSVQHGGSRTVVIPFRALGLGVPFGAFRLQAEHRSISLADQLVRSRTGEIRVTIESPGDIPVAQTYEAKLALESGVASLVQAPVRFSYLVSYPFTKTFFRVALGVIIGSLLASLGRFLLYPGSEVGPGEIVTFDRIAQMLVRPQGFIPEQEAASRLFIQVMFLALGCGVFYIACWLWLWALSKREH